MNHVFLIFHAFHFDYVMYLGVCLVTVGIEKEDKL